MDKKIIKYFICAVILIVIGLIVITYSSNKECYKMNMDKFGKVNCFHDLLKKVQYWGVCNENIIISNENIIISDEINPGNYFDRPFVYNKHSYEETCKNTGKHSVRIRCYEENFCRPSPNQQVGACGESRRSVIICGDKYFIEVFNNSEGPKLYGPFDMNP